MLEPGNLKKLSITHLPDLSARAVFSQLTHLDIDVSGDNRMNDVSSEHISTFYSSVILLPRLTHLSFSNECFESIFLDLLQNCPSLQVLFYLAHHQERVRKQGNLAADSRFVVLRLDTFDRLGSGWDWFDDWQFGVHRGMDFWLIVERFISKRRQATGEDGKRNEMTFDDSEWYVIPK
ncbi:hypothetical protein FB45DRAFT_929790 [Roridomyces roridus]|uniref:Uncharacterized protein n=1 Tax=Roridomyces roridus TaxID=1738132 RepID=A0AAD7BGH2_9AGAR|nr:hypothetical protein FB45DRAFT_929790 [Roridomyces roridus]